MKILSLLLFLNAQVFADQIRVLNRGDQSLSAYYQAIASAQHSIDVATFVMEPCQSAPKFLLNAIVAKAKSGVKVRIVVEAYTFKDPHLNNLPAWLQSQSKNIEIRRFGVSSALAGDQPRSHIKSLVIDGNNSESSFIVGGRNWTDEYFGLNAKLNYLDQDLLIRGDGALAAAKFFNELWGKSNKLPIVGDGAAYGKTCFANSDRDKTVAQFVQEKSASILGARPVHSCGDLQYVIDNPDFMWKGCGGSGPGEEFLSGDCFAQKRTTGLVLAFMKGTKEKLAMNNQYYFPYLRVRDMIDWLREKKKRSIEIFSNATGDIYDMPTHNTAFTCDIQSSGYQTFKDSQKVSLLTSRGALRDSWALSPPGAKWRIHSKTAIRDDTDVLVSSWNIDPRSYQTNLESGVVVKSCPSLAQDLNTQYDQLRETVKADKNCVPCKADFVRSNMSDTVWCGGTPVLY